MNKMNNQWIVIRQPEGEEEYYDFSTLCSSPSIARELAEWAEENTIDKAYWDANPRIGIAHLVYTETERIPE